jgi:hypothetical protein
LDFLKKRSYSIQVTVALEPGVWWQYWGVVSSVALLNIEHRTLNIEWRGKAGDVSDAVFLV